MPDVKFDRKAFLAGLQSAKEFKSVPPGFYNATLEKCYIGTSKAGRTQAVFGFRISEDDEQQGGAMHFMYQGLSTPEGEPDEMGNKVFAITLSKLGLPLEYVGEHIDELDNIMEYLIGTEVRLKLTTNEKNPDFTNTRIEKILSSPLDKNPPSAPVAKAPETVAEPVVAEDFPQQARIDVVSGDMVIVTDSEGQKLAKVLSYLNETNQLLVKFLNDGDKGIPALVEGSQCQKMANKAPAPAPKPATPPKPAPAPFEEIQEISEEVELKVGMEVSGLFNKQKVTGKIHRLDEATGKVFINMGGKAYPCPVDTISLVDSL